MSVSEQPKAIQQVECLGRKRPLDAFLKRRENLAAEPPAPPQATTDCKSFVDFPGDKENSFSSTPEGVGAAEPPKSSPGLTASGSSPLDMSSPSPNPTPSRLSDDAPVPGTASSIPASKTEPLAIAEPEPTMSASSTLTATGEPLAKRKKLTTEEKDAKEKQRAEEREKKKREKEEAEKIRTEERAAKAAEKAAEKAEKDAAKAAEKAEKDAKKRQRVEEQEKRRREKEEEEAKKERQQRKLTSMFRLNHSIPKEESSDTKVESPDGADSADTPAKPSAKEISLYDQLFKPFFLKENVRLAVHHYAWDDQTSAAKSKIFDEFATGKRGDVKATPLDEMTPSDKMELFQLPHLPRRGRVYPSVRKIMAEFQGLSSDTPIDLTTESQNTQIMQTREALKRVPLKSIKYCQDVRPPYVGTVSGLPAGVPSLRKLARKPLARHVLPLDYDYDSEAEWQEEDGEDVDMDDDEDEQENDEEMDDFLDDSEDVGPLRPACLSDMEPESTGLCWEDGMCQDSVAHMDKFRMEFIFDAFEHDAGIDPFSSSYWAPVPKGKSAVGNEGTTSLPVSAADRNAAGPTGAASSLLSGSSSAASMAPPPAPSDALQTLTQSATNAKKSQQLLPADMQDGLKAYIRNHPTLSKIGLIELFASEHPKSVKVQIKNSFDVLAEKAGKGWRVRGEC